MKDCNLSVSKVSYRIPPYYLPYPTLSSPLSPLFSYSLHSQPTMHVFTKNNKQLVLAPPLTTTIITGKVLGV